MTLSRYRKKKRRKNKVGAQAGDISKKKKKKRTGGGDYFFFGGKRGETGRLRHTQSRSPLPPFSPFFGKEKKEEKRE